MTTIAEWRDIYTGQSVDQLDEQVKHLKALAPVIKTEFELSPLIVLIESILKAKLNDGKYLHKRMKAASKIGTGFTRVIGGEIRLHREDYEHELHKAFVHYGIKSRKESM